MLIVISRNGQIHSICQVIEINSSEALKECILIVKKKIKKRHIGSKGRRYLYRAG